MKEYETFDFNRIIERWHSPDHPMNACLILVAKGICFEGTIGGLNGDIDIFNVTKMTHKQLAKALHSDT